MVSDTIVIITFVLFLGTRYQKCCFVEPLECKPLYGMLFIDFMGLL